MGWIASWILERILRFVSLAIPKLFLRKQLIEKLLENVVSHDAGVGVSLAFAMKDGGGRLVDAVSLAKGVILVNHGIKCATLDQRTHFGHFRRGDHGSNCAIHITVLLPLFLVLKERLFRSLHLANLRGGASIAGGDPCVRVHGKREIA